MRHPGVAERAEIDLDQNVEDEGDEDQDMYGVNDAHPAEEIDLSGETLHVPHQDAGVDLDGQQQHHDDLVDHALQRIELAINGGLKRVGLAPEDAEAVVIGLP